MKTHILNVRKTIAVFIAMMLMILSVSYSGNKSEAANTARAYRIFNAKTGAKIDDYTLDPLSPNNNTRAVIGDDDRVIDWAQSGWKKSGVVKLMDSTNYIGSGFVVSDHVIATAAHCVHGYEKNNAKPQTLSKILLFDKNGNVDLEATPVTMHVPVEFIDTVTSINDYSTTSDYALITVKEDLSEYACFGLSVPLNSFINGNATVTVKGFPQFVKNKEVNTHNTHMMYSGNGVVCGGNNSLIYYKADMSEGNSGGPVYITESAYGQTYYTVVGINVAHPSKNAQHNIGTRMTTDLIHFYSGNNTYISW